jgi:hypothetical protein
MKEKHKIEMEERYRKSRHKIFVFGSDLAGRHGAGSALHAKKYHGAETGMWRGRTGNAYAIPTKDAHFNTLPLYKIWRFVEDFISYAKQHPELEFFVVAIGTGLAGYKHEDMACMFINAPSNCELPPEWIEINNNGRSS